MDIKANAFFYNMTCQKNASMRCFCKYHILKYMEKQIKLKLKYSKELGCAFDIVGKISTIKVEFIS
jgi:hypothetical protein